MLNWSGMPRFCVIRQPSIVSEMPVPDPGQATKDDIVMSVTVSKYHRSQNIAHSQKVFFFSFCCIPTETHQALTVSTQWVQSKVCQHLRSLSEAKISSHDLQALSSRCTTFIIHLVLIGDDKCDQMCREDFRELMVYYSFCVSRQFFVMRRYVVLSAHQRCRKLDLLR